jgi:hypothetical protein
MDKVRSKDGTLIAYERSGEGPALVLVHGTSADHTRWKPIIPLLEQKWQCADFSVKSQISRSYGVENSISEEQNYTQHTKTWL